MSTTLPQSDRTTVEPATGKSSTATNEKSRLANNESAGSCKYPDHKRSRLCSGSLRNKFHESWKAFIRAFSLSLLAHTLRGLRYPVGRGFHEPTKIALNHTRVVAFVRNLIHVIPFGFALFEVILNWNVYYVGTQPYGTAVYQIIAKAHEILIQASLSTIMFSAIRRDLAYGKGLPFGFLFSGLQITQISYLWSMELWGAIRADSVRITRRIGFFLLLIGSIVLAATCGPSSAVLLTPRVQQWPAGRTRIWVNATAEEIWPARMDGAAVSKACSTIGSTASDACPASEWYALRDFLSAMGPHLYAIPGGYTVSLDYCLLHGQSSGRNLRSGRIIDIDHSLQMTHTATTQQAVVADALSATGALWFWSLTNVTANAGHGSPLSDQTNAAHRIDSDYRQPVSSVTCVPASVTNKTDSRHVVFPIFPYEEQSNANIQTVSSRDRTRQYKVIEHPTFMYSQLLDITGDVESYRLKWVELPPDKFNYSSIGLAILPPVSRSESASQTVVFCNIAASWGQSALEIETSGSGMGIAKSVVDDGKPTRARRHIGENQIPDAESWAANLGPSPIIILEDWARYLDPFIEELNATVFNVLMDSSNRTDPDRYLVSGVLSMLITNGLARTAWGSNLQGNVRVKGPNGHGPVDGDYWLANKGDVFQVDPVESRNWTSFVVESSLEGYAYNTLTVSPRIAIAIMMVYCLLVLGHTFYSGITGISSNCWDTIAEVTALAINSTPTAALRNTCAGISELHVFKLPVRILVSRDEEGEGEHLELVFGKIDDESAKARTIKPNTTYGTLPKGYIGEGKKDV